MKRNLWFVLFLGAMLGLFAMACGNDEEEDNDVSGEGEGEGDVEIAIDFGDERKTVSIDTLSTHAIGEADVVLISKIIEASGIMVDLSVVTLDFEGTDGYRPSQKPFCADFLPTAGANADKVGVNLADENTLVWEESLAMDKCAAVKDLGKIYILSE
jgi:hypothetical protein